MRAAAIALFIACAVAVPSAIATPPPVIGMGNVATAAGTARSVSLRLHYPMTCGQPGPGPLVVELPTAFRIRGLRVTVQGHAAPSRARGHTVTAQLPRPPQVTCMSITEGVLRVTLAGVHTTHGAYTVHAQVRNRTFSARLRIA